MDSLRSIRIAHIALFDITLAIVGIYFFIRWLVPNKSNIYYTSWTLVSLFPISIIAHLVTNTPTMLNYYLGLSNIPS